MTIDDVTRQFTSLSSDRSGRFDDMVGAVFAFQRARCDVYARYCHGVAAPVEHDERTLSAGHAGDHRRAYDGEMPPFLPVEAFKHAPVTTFPPGEADVIFESSGTGQGTPSRHFVRDRAIYERAVQTHFRQVFGPGPFIIVAHLPAYAEQSSLVYMLRHVIDMLGAEGSGFFLDEPDLLDDACDLSRRDGTRLIVFGAAFGLIDLLSRQRRVLPDDALVIETGGMKTYRREMTRETLHARLAEGFGIERAQVRSEYGMCELMSQCYTHGGATFYPPPWMHFRIVDPFEPTSEIPEGRSGALALIDLANVWSCSFLLTGDRALRREGGFEVLGRLTGAELRGCNFLFEDA